jgi:hypothetical protein
MHVKALVPFAIGLVASFATAQHEDVDKKPAAEHKMPAAERATAEGKIDVGSIKIEYGVPTWNDKFADHVKPGGEPWRLGNNLPTSCVIDCGLDAAQGRVLPGSYKLALKYVKENVAHLVLYRGSTFFAEGLPMWEIASDSFAKDDANKASKLAIDVKDGKIGVAFGPYKTTFPLKGIKAHEPYMTEFANVEAKVTVLALPLGEAALKDARVGVVDIEQNGVKTSWDLALTIDGDKAALAFKSHDAATVAKDKETVSGIVKQIEAMIAEKPEMKEMAGPFVTMFQKQLADLELKEKMLGRLAGEKTLESTAAALDPAVKTLGYKAERPEGGLTLKFDAKDKTASFEIKPREFMQRRRQQ